jgi:hypothetical protein
MSPRKEKPSRADDVVMGQMGVNLTAPAILRVELPRRRAARMRPASPCPTTVDAKRCGTNEDRALYACGCGYAFKAAVTTSVGCPECGTQQAW